MTSANLDFITPEEYLEMEAVAETKSEYIDGQIFAMSPGVSVAHNLIAVNIASELKDRFHGRPCKVFFADIRVKVTRRAYLYPDVIAVCGKAKIEKFKFQDTLLNPTVIFEVLSPSTESYDLGKKLHLYRGIDSLQQYVCASQSEMLVTNHVRRGKEWVVSDVGDSLALPSIECTLTLAEIYEGVELTSQ
jgi:Uma2 family endonuclease